MIFYPKEVNDKITTGLNTDEFRCRCNYESCRATIIAIDLVRSYRKFRMFMNMPLTILSGYRCTLHNHMVEGAALSRHQSGQAIDIYTGNILEKYTIDQIKDFARQAGFTFIKYYEEKNFVHLDVR